MPWDPASVFVPVTWRDSFLTVEQLAAVAGLTPKAVYNLHHRALSPPAYKIGRRLRFFGGEVEAWLRGKAPVGQAEGDQS